MSFFISVTILILATLIQSSMQLVPGIFSLFYHYALGKNSTSKTSNLSSYFILGTITFMSVIWLFVYASVFTIFCNEIDVCTKFIPWLMAGVLLAEGIACFFFYFRKGKFTTLFLPRVIAKNLELHAQKVKSRSDAFILGLFSGIPELIFTLPLYFISTIEIMKLGPSVRPIFIIIYIFLSVVPLFIIRTLYRNDYNLAKIERLRVRTKTAVKVFISIGFAILAIATVILGVLNHG